MGSRVLLIVLILVLLIAIAEGARRQRPVETGPDLPYPCWVVRWAAATYTEAQLEQMGRDKGIILSRKQRRQARECLAG